MKTSALSDMHFVWTATGLRRSQLTYRAQERLLREAFDHDEATRYKRIKTYLKEHGGCRCWDWQDTHIETKLVTLGLEDMKPADSKKPRGRKRNSASQPSMGSGHLGSEIWMGSGPGTNSLAFPHPLHLTTQNLQHDYRPPHYRGVLPTPITPQQHDQLVEDVYRFRSGPSSPMSVDEFARDDDILSDQSPHGQPGSPGFDNAQSERMARQACDQIIQEGGVDSEHYPAPPTRR
jgi:hypothetical protein